MNTIPQLDLFTSQPNNRVVLEPDQLAALKADPTTIVSVTNRKSGIHIANVDVDYLIATAVPGFDSKHVHLKGKFLAYAIEKQVQQLTETEIRADERKLADLGFALKLEALANEYRNKYRTISTSKPITQQDAKDTVDTVLQPTYKQIVVDHIYKYPDYVKEILALGLTVDSFAALFAQIVESEYEVAQTSDGWGIRNIVLGKINKRRYDTFEEATRVGLPLYKGYRVGHIEQHHPQHWLKMKNRLPQ